MNSSSTSLSKNRRGSALLASIILVVVIASLVGVYLQSANQELRLSQQTYFMQSALNLAEAGIEEALYEFNNGTFGDSAPELKKTYTESYLTNNLNEITTIRVYGQYLGANSVKIWSEGRIRKGGVEASKQLEVSMTRRPLFQMSVAAKSQFKMTGNKTTFASYDSRENETPVDDPKLNSDGGSVGSTSVVVAVDIGNAYIWGNVATGMDEVDVGPNGYIQGTDTGTDEDGNLYQVDPERVTTDFYAEFDTVSIPPYPGVTWLTTEPSIANGATGYMGTSGSKTYYHLSSLDDIKGELVLQGDVVLIVDGDIDISGQLTVDENSSVEIYAREDVMIGGNGIVYPTPFNDATKFMIYGVPRDDVSSQTIKIHGNGNFVGGVYAPEADFELKGSGSTGKFWGGAVAKNVTIVGNYDVRYDHALDDISNGNKLKISSWKELLSASEKKNFDTLVGPRT